MGAPAVRRTSGLRRCCGIEAFASVMLVCNDCRRATSTGPMALSSPPLSSSPSPPLSPNFARPQPNKSDSLGHRHPSPTYPEMFALKFESPTCVAMQAEGFVEEDFKLSDAREVVRYGTGLNHHLKQPQTLLLEHSMTMHVAELRRRPKSGARKMNDLQEKTVFDSETYSGAEKLGTAAERSEDMLHKLVVPAVLSLLVVQNASQMLSMRYSKVISEANGSQSYISSTAVVVSEILKVCACLLILAAQHRSTTFSRVYR